MNNTNDFLDGYKFSETATEKMPEITQDKIINKINKGFTCDFLFDNIISFGIFKIDGWLFDCKNFLKLYVVKTNEGIFETYNINKTNVRKIYKNIAYILEVK